MGVRAAGGGRDSMAWVGDKADRCNLQPTGPDVLACCLGKPWGASLVPLAA